MKKWQGNDRSSWGSIDLGEGVIRRKTETERMHKSKEVWSYILRIVRAWSLFFQKQFIEVCVFYFLFWETNFFVFLYLVCFLFATSFEFYLIFTDLQHLHNHCFYKCHLGICNFVLTLWNLVIIAKTIVL